MWWHTVTHGRGSEGKNWWMEWVASTLHTTSEHCVSPALLPLMLTPRPPVVDWTDAPARPHSHTTRQNGVRKNPAWRFSQLSSIWGTKLTNSNFVSKCVSFAWLAILITLRTGSFKLFKRPFPGFLTILTL